MVKPHHFLPVRERKAAGRSARKIRQQLQVLRDGGWLMFEGRGRYRLRAGS